MKSEYRFLVATSFVTLLATASDVAAAGSLMPAKEQAAAPVVEAIVTSNVAATPTPVATPTGK